MMITPHFHRGRRGLSLCIAAAALGAPAAGSAQTAGAARERITLAAATAAALHDNPDVLLARTTLDSARAERRIAAALPNPTLATVPNSPFQYSATLPLDITPARFLRTRSAALGVRASEADGGDTARQVRLAVARAFFDLLLAERKRDAAGDRRSAVHQLLTADSVRYRSGDIPFHNLARSEVEMMRADADFARADVDVHSGKLALQALMGRSRVDTAFDVDGSLDYQPFQPRSDSLVAIALAARPDLLATNRRIEQSAVAKRSTLAMLIPVPALSYVRQYAAPFDNGHYGAIGLSFELPSLDFFGGQRARAAAGERAATLARDRVTMQIERDVSSALAEFQIQRTLVERYQSGVLTRVDESVDAVRYAYSSGASSLLDVLDAVRARQDVRIGYYSALHDYWLSVYGLNAAVGVDVFPAP